MAVNMGLVANLRERSVLGETGETKLTDNWPPFAELPPELPKIPELPEEMIPLSLRAWLVDIALRASIPLIFVVAPAMVALGAVVGRKIGIRPGRFDDWTVVANLWGGIIGRPGMMKSYAISEAIKPISRLAVKASERFKDERANFEACEIERKAEIDAIKKNMEKVARNKGDTSVLKQELVARIQEANDEQVSERRYLTQDATVEKLGELLRENPQGLLVARDELSGWLSNMEKSGREGDREFYLESWNGTGGYTFDRIGRGTVHIPAVCLSIAGGIQPGKLKSYILGAINENGKGDDGLLQRLQLLVWPDRPGEWKEVERWPDASARNNAYSIFDAIDNLQPQDVNAECDPDGIPYLRFSLEGQAVFNEWRNGLENRLRSDEFVNTPAYESHISKYRSLMPSLALIFHLVDVVSGATDQVGFVSEEAAESAAAWCEYLELHAKKIYAAELESENQTAHLLAAKIKSGSIRSGDTIRDIHQHDWTGLRAPEKVKQGLKVLESHHWVRIVTQQTGGRPTEIIYIHPDIKVGSE